MVHVVRRRGAASIAGRTHTHHVLGVLRSLHCLNGWLRYASLQGLSGLKDLKKTRSYDLKRLRLSPAVVPGAKVCTVALRQRHRDSLSLLRVTAFCSVREGKI